MWIRAVIIFFITITCSLFLTPQVRRLALRFHIIEKSDSRKVHKRVITCLGGVAIYLAFIIGLICGYFLIPKTLISSYLHYSAALISGGTIIFILGVYDDIKEANARTKISWQVIAAFVTISVFNIRITYFTLPVLGRVELGILSIPFTLMWVMGITNAINWIDGLDGLAAGVSSIACIALSIISWRGGGMICGFITIALLGSILGFLRYNFYPAKVFMGDGGSNFLGFILANVAIIGSLKSATLASLAVPILILGIPVFDTLFSVLRRIYLKRSPIMPDRDHLHFRLIKLGFSHQQSVLIIYLVSLILSICAILLSESSSLTSLSLVVLVVGFLGIIAWRAGLLSISFRGRKMKSRG
ncbi:undecaprenyl/decaprenyl-phosphate alpha-N-acetylglucosaminyl 1-phosphate transferase [Candidatus Aerophobetes bacterium]|nr:undecaprenyl/decaprenyl-phosphate alpha-N-acetylglucosaminyl 1-phosphate transferase [Candidatus Aerophobetes bacterium]